MKITSMNFKKVVSLIVLGCFLLSFAVRDAACGIVEARRTARPVDEVAGDVIIPHSLGRITRAWAPGAGVARSAAMENNARRVVVHIQDLHCHAEVQRNIARILSLLDGKYKLNKVYVEGAAGAVDTSWLCGIRDRAFRESITEALADQGKLTGGEYYSVTANRPDVLSGLEDEPVYAENLLRLNRIIENAPRYTGIVVSLRQELAAIKGRYFGAGNNRFERTLEKYRRGELSSARYYRFLRKQVEELNERNKKNGDIPVISLQDYPNMSGYLEMAESGASLNYRGIARQLQAFLPLLRQRLPYAAYRELSERTENFTRLNELYVYLAQVSRDYAIDLKSGFPHLARFFDYLEKSRNIDPVKLLWEEQRLAEEIRVGLSLDRAEREVSFLADFFGYFEGFLKNKLSAEDYAYFAARFGRFQTLWAKYAGTERLAELKNYVDLLQRYYATNLERDRRFVKNVFPAITDNGDGAVPGGPVAAPLLLEHADELVVIVTGGFHTRGVTGLLERNGISYLTIVPNVSRDTKESDAVYRERARQQAAFSTQTLALRLLSKYGPDELLATVVEAEGLRLNDTVSLHRTMLEYAEDRLKEVMGDRLSRKELERAMQEIGDAWNTNDALRGMIKDDDAPRLVFRYVREEHGRHYFKFIFVDGSNAPVKELDFTGDKEGIHYPVAGRRGRHPVTAGQRVIFRGDGQKVMAGIVRSVDAEKGTAEIRITDDEYNLEAGYRPGDMISLPVAQLQPAIGGGSQDSVAGLLREQEIDGLLARNRTMPPPLPDIMVPWTLQFQKVLDSWRRPLLERWLGWAEPTRKNLMYFFNNALGLYLFFSPEKKNPLLPHEWLQFSWAQTMNMQFRKWLRNNDESPFLFGNSEIDAEGFSGEHRSQYALIGEILAKQGVSTAKPASVTSAALANVFNELAQVPNLRQLLDENKGLAGVQPGRADGETIMQNKQLLAARYPHTLARRLMFREALKKIQDTVKFLSEVEEEEPQWFSKHRVLDMGVRTSPAFRLLDFSYDENGNKTRDDIDTTLVPKLIIPPNSGHTSPIADDGDGKSIVQTLQKKGQPVYAIDWQTATTQNIMTMSDMAQNIVNAIDALGGRVQLVGLCQGGWAAIIVAALYPEKVISLEMSGSPIDAVRGDNDVTRTSRNLPMEYFNWFVHGFGQENVYDGFTQMKAFLESGDWWNKQVMIWMTLVNNIDSAQERERARKFITWYFTLLDISLWYLQCVEDLFKDNKLFKGELRIRVGDEWRTVDLSRISCPVVTSEGEKDDITPPGVITKEQLRKAVGSFITDIDGLWEDLKAKGYINDKAAVNGKENVQAVIRNKFHLPETTPARMAEELAEAYKPAAGVLFELLRRSPGQCLAAKEKISTPDEDFLAWKEDVGHIGLYNSSAAQKHWARAYDFLRARLGEKIRLTPQEAATLAALRAVPQDTRQRTKPGRALWHAPSAETEYMYTFFGMAAQQTAAYLGAWAAYLSSLEATTSHVVYQPLLNFNHRFLNYLGNGTGMDYYLSLWRNLPSLMIGGDRAEPSADARTLPAQDSRLRSSLANLFEGRLSWVNGITRALLLAALITPVHELGHLIIARLTGQHAPFQWSYLVTGTLNMEGLFPVRAAGVGATGLAGLLLVTLSLAGVTPFGLPLLLWLGTAYITASIFDALVSRYKNQGDFSDSYATLTREISEFAVKTAYGWPAVLSAALFLVRRETVADNYREIEGNYPELLGKNIWLPAATRENIALAREYVSHGVNATLVDVYRGEKTAAELPNGIVVNGQAHRVYIGIKDGVTILYVRNNIPVRGTQETREFLGNAILPLMYESEHNSVFGRVIRAQGDSKGLAPELLGLRPGMLLTDPDIFRVVGRSDWWPAMREVAYVVHGDAQALPKTARSRAIFVSDVTRPNLIALTGAAIRMKQAESVSTGNRDLTIGVTAGKTILDLDSRSRFVSTLSRLGNTTIQLNGLHETLQTIIRSEGKRQAFARKLIKEMKGQGIRTVLYGIPVKTIVNRVTLDALESEIESLGQTGFKGAELDFSKAVAPLPQGEFVDWLNGIGARYTWSLIRVVLPEGFDVERVARAITVDNVQLVNPLLVGEKGITGRDAEGRHIVSRISVDTDVKGTDERIVREKVRRALERLEIRTPVSIAIEDLAGSRDTLDLLSDVIGPVHYQNLRDNFETLRGRFVETEDTVYRAVYNFGLADIPAHEQWRSLKALLDEYGVSDGDLRSAISDDTAVLLAGRFKTILGDTSVAGMKLGQLIAENDADKLARFMQGLAERTLVKSTLVTREGNVKRGFDDQAYEMLFGQLLFKAQYTKGLPEWQIDEVIRRIQSGRYAYSRNETRTAEELDREIRRWESALEQGWLPVHQVLAELLPLLAVFDDSKVRTTIEHRIDPRLDPRLILRLMGAA